MPDITKFHPTVCDIRHKCYRYTSISDAYLQSYCDFSVSKEKKIKGVCAFFMPTPKKGKPNGSK